MRRALAVFLLGAHSLLAQPYEPSLGILEVNAQIEQVFLRAEAHRFEEAAQLYLWTLQQIGGPLSAAERNIITHDLQFLAMVMPAADRAQTGLDQILLNPTSATEQHSENLVRWWRSRDPLPATVNNERLQEHLARVVFATKEYADRDDRRGVDDRGEIYIRLGRPSRMSSIELHGADLRIHPYAVRLPDNEFWVYRHVHDAAHYLFLRRTKNTPYALGIASDLIPLELRGSRRKTEFLLAFLEDVFAQLALEHPRFGITYDAVSNYRTLPSYGAPYLFAHRLIERVGTEDNAHLWSRANSVPASYSNVFDRVGQLIPALRWARFLESDGMTRVEAYWALDSGSLRPRRRLVARLRREGHTPSEEYLLSVSVSRKDSTHQVRRIDRRDYFVSDSRQQSLSRTWTAAGYVQREHLALQWEQQWTQQDAAGVRIPGATLKIGTRAINAMDVLHGDGVSLEMSDIKPLFADGGSGSAAPYPYARLSSSIPLSLYFELYHLRFDSVDQTRYTVEYSVEYVQDNQGGERISVSSHYEGTTAVAREQIVLDLSALPKPGPIEVTIRASDDVSGDTMQRSIRFDFIL